MSSPGYDDISHSRVDTTVLCRSLCRGVGGCEGWDG